MRTARTKSLYRLTKDGSPLTVTENQPPNRQKEKMMNLTRKFATVGVVSSVSQSDAGDVFSVNPIPPYIHLEREKTSLLLVEQSQTLLIEDDLKDRSACRVPANILFVIQNGLVKIGDTVRVFVDADDICSYMEEKGKNPLKASCVIPFELNDSLSRTEIVKG